MAVQHQAISIDCGVFSMAFVTHCVFDKKPETATCKTDLMQTEGMFNTKQI